ncbi:MAG TPA: DUF4252 domain-containing protein [Steroidobacteraceae bacterium]
MSCIKAAILGLSLLVPALCSAQHPAFRIPPLADLRRDAVESTNITVGPLLLWFASRVVSNGDPQSAALGSLLHGLHKVQVHSYAYKADHVYRTADLEALRSQLTRPGWHQMVRVHERDAHNDTAIYYTQEDRTVTGLVVLVAEPREFTLVNISGKIDMRNVAALCGTFMPHQPGESQVAWSLPKPDAYTPDEASDR